MQAPPPGPQSGPPPSNYPRPNLVGDREVLREIATSQKQVLYCVLGQIAVGVLNRAAISGHIPILQIVDMILAVGLLIYMVIAVIRLAKALGLSQALYAILMFIPCVSLIVLLIISGKATAKLSQAGIKVGFLGADPNSI